ncbi:MAG TPA: signal peptidase I [Polyangiaceae bacterium]|nr:signal peptidase I [Polyangiaceae bacterium]
MITDLWHVKKAPILRFGFYTFWFGIIPAILAIVTVFGLSPNSAAEGGPLVEVRNLIKDQPVPAVIVLFTLFEMLLYSIRDRLPLAEHLSYAGPAGMPKEIRIEYEQAEQLLVDARRLLSKKRRAIEKELGSSVPGRLTEALDALETSMQREPLDPSEFHDAHDTAGALVQKHLARWQKSDAREYAESIIIAVAVALFLRAFVVEAFKIPSGSMLPTLQLQDHIFVNKLVYGPPVPWTKTRIFSSLPPKRGDVIVFEFPNPEPGPRQDYIKRVIALPGDTLEVVGGHPLINGWRVPSCSAGPYDFDDGTGIRSHGELFVEYLGDYSYLTFYLDNQPQREQGPYHVAPGEVWVLGDNRHNSSDSRAWNHELGGGAPYENIKGRALFVWLTFGPDGFLTFQRLLTSVMGTPKLPKGTSTGVIAAVERCLQQRPSQTNPPAPKASPTL